MGMRDEKPGLDPPRKRKGKGVRGTYAPAPTHTELGSCSEVHACAASIAAQHSLRIEIDAKVRTGTRPPCIQIHAIDAGSRINQSIAPVPHPVTQVLNLTLKMDKAAEHDAGAGP